MSAVQACLHETTQRPKFHRLLCFPFFAGMVAFLLHLAANPHYGYFRDELYFIACGRHPAWNYVDQPPVAPLLAAATQAFGHSLFLLRAVPAAFAGLGIYVTCLLAMEMGGAVFAQLAASITVFFIPVLCDFGMKVSPDMVGLWIWPLIALYVVRLTKGGNPRLWLWVGVASGFGILGKYSIIFFLAALVLGLLLTPHRKILFTPYFLYALLICGLIVLPSFLWQVHFGYPMLETLRNTHGGKNVIAGPGTYLVQQLLLSGFLPAVWLIGLVWLLRNREMRYLGLAYIAMIAIMITLKGKNYYPFDIYPYLAAAGGVVIERWTAGSRAAQSAVAVALVFLGLLTAPLVLPILPEPIEARYLDAFHKAIHIPNGSLESEHVKVAELPTDFTGMHGWPELAATVQRVYDSLPSEERREAVVFARNYSDAGAVEFYTNLPVISGHNNYYLWGPRGANGNVFICPAWDCGGKENYDSCSGAAVFNVPWTDSNLRGESILVCRGLKKPIEEFWPEVKVFQ